MKTLLYVYADLPWETAPLLVGELTREQIRGNESYTFSFEKTWLNENIRLKLSADLNNYPGIQHAAQNELFGCFSDSLPDRWGRTLMKRKEQIQATLEKRPVRELTSFDFLSGIDDYSRMGALRYAKEKGGPFLNDSGSLRTPPFCSLPELIEASLNYEKNTEDGRVPEQKWLNQLEMPGSSLGGARPKANIIHEGKLYIAKFPSRNDDYNTGLWENIACTLAKNAGISVPHTFVKQIKNPLNAYHTFFSERFDRVGQDKRVHFASAMTMLGLKDGDNHASEKGYLDIVDFIISSCTNVDQDLQQLYRRIAFNISIGNSDDHFRNHGFILTRNGWTLAPAYDMNPTNSRFQSLLINASTNEASLDVLLKAADKYFIAHDTARQIIAQVCTAVKEWRTIAQQAGASKQEMNLFELRMDDAAQWLQEPKWRITGATISKLSNGYWLHAKLDGQQQPAIAISKETFEAWKANEMLPEDIAAKHLAESLQTKKENNKTIKR